MTSDLYDDILDAINDREAWATRMDGFYRMRFKGIGRTSKPYPGAPDMKYGLPDALIEKLKALYIQQIYSNEMLAEFVSTKEQDAEATTSAGQWFDYQLKQQSNFERMLMIGVDKMLESGFVPIKIFWNSDKKQVCFDAVDPLNIIVPKHTDELSDADFLVHVMPFSVAQYKRNAAYNQDPAFIKRITGKGTNDAGQLNAKEQSEDFREGLTCGSDDNEIMLWEVYSVDASNNVTVDTIAPVIGWNDDAAMADQQVRASFGVPLVPMRIPFAKLRMEMVDKGWYSSRGIVELTAPHEQGLSKIWNAKLQFIDFFGSPTFTSDPANPIPASTNVKNRPGSILPPGLLPTPSQSAPLDFEAEMQFTRALAEDRVAVPDLNASEHLSGNHGASGGTTATQINAIVGQSGQSNDLRARVFRLDLGNLYLQAWQVLVQNKKADVKFILQGGVQQLTDDAIHLEYIIAPNGSADSWNKANKAQVAMALYQIIMSSPFGNKSEALKWLIEETSDPALIKRLYVDPNQELKTQAEQQAQEISIMLLGYPAEVQESDDDKTHLLTLGQFVQRRMGAQEQITPEFATLALQHGGEHVAALQQKKDPAAKQVIQQTLPLVQLLQQIAAAPSPGQMPPSAGPVPQSPQNAGAPAAAAPPSPPQQADPDELQKTAVQIGNMLVNASKAGMPIDAQQIDAVFARLALPPLTPSQHMGLTPPQLPSIPPQPPGIQGP